MLGVFVFLSKESSMCDFTLQESHSVSARCRLLNMDKRVNSSLGR